MLIEKLLYYSRRMIPNIVLNHIYNNNILFVSDKYTPEDIIHFVGEHEVKEIVDNEIMKQMRRIRAEDVITSRRGQR